MKTRITYCCAILVCAAGIASAQPRVGDCKIFPKDNPWNQDISKLPVHPMSSVYVNTVGATRSLHPDWGATRIYGIPFEVVGADQPLVPITYDPSGYPDESDPGPWPIPLNARVEGDSTATGYQDKHVLVLDTGHCMLYELYLSALNASKDGWVVYSSAKFDLNKDEYRPDGWTSADAAGLPIYPGLVKYSEVMSGEIKHAIRFTVPKTQGGWIHPARHKAGSGDSTYMPMGLRMRLKATTNLSGLTGGALVIATAMKKYGIILADNGSAWFITGATDLRWDDNNISQLKTLHGSDFEAVYTGPIKKSEETGAGIMLYSDSLSITASNASGVVFSDTATIVNTGNATLTISAVQALDPRVTVTRPAPIPGGGSAKLIASVTGPLSAAIETKIIITSNATGHPRDTVSVHVHTTTTGVDEIAPLMPGLTAYPNPFAASTEIAYTLPAGAPVTLTVYSALGTQVKVVTQEFAAAGRNIVRIDGSDLPNGVYPYTLRAGNYSTSSMMIVRH